MDFNILNIEAEKSTQLPLILLLPGNHAILIQRPRTPGYHLPPILPSIPGPRTPRTLRRLPIQELLNSLVRIISGTLIRKRRTIKKKRKKEATQDERIKVHAY